MDDKKKEEKNLGTEVSRRDFIKGAATSALAVAATGVLSACATPGAAGRAAGGPSPIFEPTKIGTLTLKNKLIRGAMGERRSDANGSPTPALIRMYEEEAAGGIGMIITGLIGVLKEDHYGPRFAGFYDASQIPAYKAAADAVHRNGGKLCAQISLHSAASQAHVGGLPVASPFDVATMTREDIRRGANAFAQTAVWLRDAGFDAINFHFAHIYLLAQFWAHFHNPRTDEYGGSAENRARFAFEVVEAVRRAVGRDFPLTAKINSNEHFVRPGSSQDETNFYAQGLADRGINAIEISGIGMRAEPIRPNILSREDHNYFSWDARNIARSVNVPMIVTGGIRNVDLAEEAFKHNDKLVGLGLARTILAEPDLPNKWQKDPKHTPLCISCNWCMANLFGENDRALCIFDRNRA